VTGTGWLHSRVRRVYKATTDRSRIAGCHGYVTRVHFSPERASSTEEIGDLFEKMVEGLAHQ